MVVREKKQRLQRIFWDYQFSEDELLDLLHGRRESLGSFTRSALVTRMFEYMNWFDIVDYLDRDFFISVITPQFIDGLKEKDLQQGVTFVRNFLLGESLPAAK